MRYPSDYEIYLRMKTSKYYDKGVPAELIFEWDAYTWMRRFSNDLIWKIGDRSLSKEYDERCLNMRNSSYTRMRCLPPNLKEAVLFMCNIVSDTLDELHNNEREYFRGKRVLSYKGVKRLEQMHGLIYEHCIYVKLTPEQRVFIDSSWDWIQSVRKR